MSTVDANPSKKSGATPLKLVLVGVLSVVLVVVLIVQFGGESAPAAPERRADSAQRATSGRRAAPAARQADAPQPQAAVSRRDWPNIPLAETLSHNPFVLPKSLRSANTLDESGAESDLRKEALQAALAQLREQGVGFVLMSDKQRVATIGGREVKVGDLIEGFRVVEINPDGIVLVEATP